MRDVIQLLIDVRDNTALVFAPHMDEDCSFSLVVEPSELHDRLVLIARVAYLELRLYGRLS